MVSPMNGKMVSVTDIPDEVFSKKILGDGAAIIPEDDTIVSPKLEFGKPNQDQEPLLDRALYKYLMEL